MHTSSRRGLKTCWRRKSFADSRKCEKMPVEIQKIMPAHPPTTLLLRDTVVVTAARRRRRLKIDCEQSVYAPTPLLHAPHAFSQLPVSAGCASPRGNVISSRYNAPAGTIPFHLRGTTNVDSRVFNVKTRALDIFIFV